MSHSVTDSTVLLGHGSGGQMMKRIIDEVFLDAFGSPELLEGNDAGVATLPASGRIAMSTDSFVVSPQVLPGGNIGRLADAEPSTTSRPRAPTCAIVRLYPRRGLSHG